MDVLRRLEADLRELVLHRLGDQPVAEELRLAGLPVDRGADVVLGPVLGLRRLLQRHLHRLEHLLAVDRLLARDDVCCLQHLDAVVCGLGLGHGG